jgi:hypothetical protein
MPRMLRRLGLVLLILLSLPILLIVYNPSMELGGLGLMLGAVGWVISPLLLFGVLLKFVSEKW